MRNNESDKAVCSICHENLTSNIITTSCSHKFHNACIKQWIETSSGPAKCPLCQASINSNFPISVPPASSSARPLSTLPPSNFMTISVMKMDGRSINISNLTANTKIGDVKNTVASNEGIPISNVRLLFLGKMRSDEKTLAECGITNGSTLHLLFRQVGGIKYFDFDHTIFYT